MLSDGRGTDGRGTSAVAAPRWRLARAGVPRVRFNAALRRARDQRSYPVRITVTMAWDGAADLGAVLPAVPPVAAGTGLAGAGAVAGPVPPSLTVVQATVMRVVAGRAVPAVTISAPDTMQFVLYTAGPEWLGEAGGALQAALAGWHVQVVADPDPRWLAYRQAITGRRRLTTGRVTTWLLPLLCGVVVWAHYGGAWGLAEGAACLAWVAVVFADAHGGHGIRRRHAGWSFALLVLIFGSLFFGLAALYAGTILAAPASAGVGVGAGAALTAALWPGRRRRLARQQALRMGQPPPTAGTGARPE